MDVTEQVLGGNNYTHALQCRLVPHERSVCGELCADLKEIVELPVWFLSAAKLPEEVAADVWQVSSVSSRQGFCGQSS